MLSWDDDPESGGILFLVLMQGEGAATYSHNLARERQADAASFLLCGEEWDKLLQSSKFSEKNWPYAYNLLKNCGGDGHKGYFGFQDHGDEVWYRNIRVKVLK